MSAVSLAHIRLQKEWYQSRLLDMDNQLASLISTQIIETKQALKLLELSQVDIGFTDQNVKQIDELCTKCKGYLDQFDEIKTLSVARKNLQITTKIRQLFDEVPKKAQQLLVLLENNPDKYLFYIYKNLRKLVKLRDETLKKGSIYINDEKMTNHFKCIDKVITNLEKQIRSNIYSALYLAIKQPEVLVETMKICESEDRTNAKNKILRHSINDWNKWRDLELNEDEKLSFGDDNNDSMIDKVKSEILSFIINLTEDLQSEKENGIKSFLQAIDENMKDLYLVNDRMRSTFPPKYDIVKYYISMYYKFLQPLILAQLDTKNVPTQERLFTVSWISSFKTSINNLEKELNKYGDTLRVTIDEMIINLSDQEQALLDSHIKTCHNTLSKWITNMIDMESKERDENDESDKTEKDKYFIKNNIPRIHGMQFLFRGLDQQFITATQYLRGQSLVIFIKMILNTMIQLHHLLNQYITNNYLSFENDEYFAALLNSCYDVSQKLEDKSYKILNQYDLYQLNEEQINCLQTCFEQTIAPFTKMAKNCSILLAQKIFMDFKDNVFLVLFTSEYFDRKPQENEYIINMIFTINQYLDDYKQWIEESYFYWELVKAIIDVVTDKYIESLFKNTLKTMDPENLANYVRNDIKHLNEYFGNKDEFRNVDKLWQKKIKVLDGIGGALDAEDGFFDVIAKPLLNDEKYGERLLKFIKKLRKKNKKDGNKLQNSKVGKWINTKVYDEEL